MGMFSFLHGGHAKNPADDAMPYLNKIPDQMKQYYNPYIQQGNRAGRAGEQQYNDLMGLGPDLMEKLSGIMQDPTGFLKSIGEGYESSPGYEFAKDQAMQAIGNAGAAGGMVGTPQHQQQAGDMASNLASKDYNEYLKNALSIFRGGTEGLGKLFGLGVEGNERNTQRGFTAGTNLADSLAANLQSKADYAYNGRAYKNAQKQGNAGGFFSAAAPLIGSAAGWALGGPAGGAVGKGVGDYAARGWTD